MRGPNILATLGMTGIATAFGPAEVPSKRRPTPDAVRPPTMRIETLAVHAGHDVDPATAAVTPPIHLSTTFAREADGSYRAGFLYSRYTNPNRAALETLPRRSSRAAPRPRRSRRAPRRR